MIRGLPPAEGGEAQTLEDQRIHGITEEDLGQRVLAVMGGKELFDRLIREREEFFPGEAGLVLLDLILDPLEVALAGGGERFDHAVKW